MKRVNVQLVNKNILRKLLENVQIVIVENKKDVMVFESDVVTWKLVNGDLRLTTEEFIDYIFCHTSRKIRVY